MSLQEAFAATLAKHPQLRAFAHQLAIQNARVEAASQRPPIEGSLEVENVLGSGALRGAQAAEITLGIGSLVERGGKRDARVLEAQRAMELLTFEQRMQTLDLLAETARRFIAVSVAQQAASRAEQYVDQSRRTLTLISPRVEAARSPPTERLNAEVELSEAQLAQQSAIADLDAARFGLAMQWNAPAQRPLVSADLDELPAVASFELLSRQIEKLPDLQRYAAEQRVREAQLQLARSQTARDWRWSAGVRRMEEFDDEALVLGLSVPLGARHRSQPMQREAQSALSEVRPQLEARRVEILSTLYAQWNVLNQARQTHAMIEAELLPRAARALELTQRGYEIGRFAYRELALAQRQLLDLQVRSLDAAARYHLTRIELERLTGAQLQLIEESAP